MFQTKIYFQANVLSEVRILDGYLLVAITKMVESDRTNESESLLQALVCLKYCIPVSHVTDTNVYHFSYFPLPN